MEHLQTVNTSIFTTILKEEKRVFFGHKSLQGGFFFNVFGRISA